jgi:phosphoglycolate phosphatase-like HAD superfamily hydrolase
MTILFSWDCNLTLEQGSHLIILQFMNEQAERYGYPQVDIEQVLELYGHSLDVFYKTLFKTDAETTARLLNEGQRRSRELFHLMESTPHSKEVLEAIAQAGHRSIVVSNAHNREVKKMVAKLGIESFIHVVHGIPGNPHPEIGSKVDAIVYEFSRNNFRELYVIGDSQQDVDAGKEFEERTRIPTTTILYQPLCKIHMPYSQNGASHLITDLSDVARIARIQLH